MGNPFKILRDKYRKKKLLLAAYSSVNGEVASGPESISVSDDASPSTYSERPAPDAIPPAKASLESGNEQNPEPEPYGANYKLWDRALQETGLEGLDMFNIISDDTDRKGLAADIQVNISNALEGERPESTTRKVIENSVSVLTKFIAVGDVAASFDPVHAALPWAAIRFALVLVIGTSELKGQLLAGIAAVAALVVQCDTHQQLYMAQTDTSLRPPEFALEKLAKSIVQAYVELQRFLSFVAQRQQSKLRVNAVFKVDDARDYVSKILTSEGQLQRAADDCERYCNLSSRGEIKHLVKLAADFPRTIQRQIESVLDKVDSRNQLGILQWISSMPYGQHHNTVKEARTPGTCQWLSEHDRFHEWETTNISSILWLQGSPGSGKTFLTSSVIDRVKGILEDSPENQEGFAYFYCNRNEEECRSPLAILRSYVRQLSTAVASPGYIRKPLRDLCEKARLEGSSLGLNTCKDQLLESINLYSRTTIVLDALDECDPISRWELVRVIQDLAEASERPLKIFISSRPDYDIKESFSSLPNIAIQAADNKDDIEKFVNGELDKPRRWGPISSSLRTEVVNTLCIESQGMFQWAYLQVKQVLELPTEEDIRDRLGKLPRELTKAYDEIYWKISAAKHSKLLVDRACMWIMAARHPLDSYELLSAIRVGLDGESIELVASEITEAALLDLCRHLLVVDSERNVWRFTHLSVVEYFETNHWEPLQAEAYTSKICLSLLINARYDEEGDLNPGLGLSAQFQRHVRYYWPVHVSGYDRRVAREQCEADPTLVKLLKSFLGSPDESSVEYRAWLSHDTPYIFENTAQHSMTKRDIATEHGSVFIICGYAIYTILRDWWETAEITLTQKNKEGDSPLEVAASSGHKPICEALLKRKTPADLLHHIKARALAAAIENGHMEIVQLLVDNGADTSMPLRGKMYGSPLDAAMGHRDRDLLKFLLESGADANVQLPFGTVDGTVLIQASRFGKVDTVKLLIENGAEANLLVSSGDFGSALIAAASVGNLEVVRILIENGADPNLLSPTGHYGSALAAAADEGHLEMVEFLLEHGVDPNLQVLSRGTTGSALAAAAFWGHVDCVRALLDGGAEVNLRLETGDHRTALQAALKVDQNHELRVYLLGERRLDNDKIHTAELLRRRGATED